ncbi:protein CYTOKININ-RESPONSIVE GATA TRANSCRIPTION FACTOR 1-like [Musa acuminata AAA Group]|uniref:protein CYTOKININ-RESPONSIVE GATA TRANSCRIPTION FACTOR 1-like n=1 Tax=Musa acuminata AAA Group TaxID=214697 RepID=UPI0031D015B6
MSPLDLNQVCVIPIEEGGHLPLYTLANPSSSFSCPHLFGVRHDERGGYYCIGHHLHQPQQEPEEEFQIAGSSDEYMTQRPADPSDGITEEEEPARPGKWMSPKMCFVRKTMNSTHIVVSEPRGNRLVSEFSTYYGSSSSPGGIIRVCSDCNTTKTPLWRSGPRGPKSLCNACGIRQRKARRAMAAAALNGGLVPADAPSQVQKEKELDVDRTLPFKKRCKVDTASSMTATKLCFSEAKLSSNRSSAIKKVFPQEERDAAILLMALSCGLIRS